MTPTLSREQIEKMEAGPEMDALVAERVMGLVPCDKWGLWGVGIGGNEWMHATHEPPCYNVKEPLHYSRHIAAAWEVVERLRRGFWCVGVEADDYAPEAKWHAKVYREYDGVRVQSFFGFSLSPALAICRAALLSTL